MINTKKTNKKEYVKGLEAGIPIALGYAAVAFSLGIQAKKIGFSALQSAFASAGLLASAGEYIAFTLMGASAGLLTLVVMEVITNARYLLMSCALSQKIPEDTPLWQRLLMGYCITDEMFGAAIAREGKLNPYYMFGMVTVSSPGWVIGTALGVLMGDVLPSRILSALGVALFGMFIACVIPEGKKNKIVAGVIVVSFALSFALDRIATVWKALKNLPQGVLILALTIVISLGATFLFPLSEEQENE